MRVTVGASASGPRARSIPSQASRTTLPCVREQSAFIVLHQIAYHYSCETNNVMVVDYLFFL